MDALRCYVSKSPANWDEYLPQLAGALRSAVNRSTGYTPNMLMLGREVVQPLDLVYPSKMLGQPVDPDTYVSQLVQNTRLAHQIARKKLKSSQLVTKKNYDLKICVHEYNIGDIVYVLDTASVKR